MTLQQVPYIRLWANLFNFSGKTKRSDFFVDLILHIVVLVSFVFLEIFIVEKKGISYLELPFMAFYFFMGVFLPLALIARRLNDAGLPRFYCFMVYIPLFGLSIWIMCLFKSREEGDYQALKNKRKVFATMGILTPALIVTFVAAVIIIEIFSPRIASQSKDINDYEKYVDEVKYAEKFMPDYKNDIGSYTNIDFGYQLNVYSYFMGFCSDCITLIATYDDANYELEKNNVLNKYEYLSEPFKEKDGDYIFPVATFEYDGYIFKIVPYYHFWSNSDELACISFMMVGCNDLENKVAYLYFYDFDIDFLCDSEATEEEITARMPRLIENDFVWYSSSNK